MDKFPSTLLNRKTLKHTHTHTHHTHTHTHTYTHTYTHTHNTHYIHTYSDVMTLSELKQQVYVALEPQGSGGALVGMRMEVVEARLNVMQAVFLAIQTCPSLEEDILLKGQQIFQKLFSMHFTKTEVTYVGRPRHL